MRALGLECGARLRQLARGAFPLHVRLRLRALTFGAHHLLELPARLRGAFGHLLLGFHPNPNQLGHHRPLHFGARGGDLGFETRGPLGARGVNPGRPPALGRFFGRLLGRVTSLLDRLVVALAEGAELRLQLGLESGADPVDHVAELTFRHTQALSGAGSPKVKLTANPSPTAT